MQRTRRRDERSGKQRGLLCRRSPRRVHQGKGAGVAVRSRVHQEASHPEMTGNRAGNSFGMPPSITVRRKHVSGAGSSGTSQGIAGSTKGRKDTDAPTATEELKDKSLNFINYDRLLDRGEYREGGGDIEEARLVIGSLRRNAGAWAEMGANENILDVVRNGYKLPFIETPEPACFKNNRSALNEKEFVEGAIRELVEIGGVHECRTPTRVVNPLSVSIRNGKNVLFWI